MDVEPIVVDCEVWLSRHESGVTCPTSLIGSVLPPVDVVVRYLVASVDGDDIEVAARVTSHTLADYDLNQDRVVVELFSV